MTLKRTTAALLALPARAYVRHAPGHLAKGALLRRLLEPTLRGAPRTFRTTTVDGARLSGSTRDMIQRYLYLFGVWEPNLTAWLRGQLGPGDTFIDVGANIGYFSLLGSQLVGAEGRVVAIEALPSTFEALRGNLELNDVSNVRAVSAAATATHREVTLYGGEAHNSGTTSTVPSAGLQEVATVPGTPLAALLREEEVATARVIKIDVEGAELEVLQGLAPVLDAMPEGVELVVEVAADDDAGGGGAREVLDLLAGHGFHAYRIVNDYALSAYAHHRDVSAPRRVREPSGQREDLVFSRTEAEALPLGRPPTRRS